MIAPRSLPAQAYPCVGAGHFAPTNVTLPGGGGIGESADADERVVAPWDQIGDRHSVHSKS